jgi:alkanesulfonate monooxygenase SsuD/methylene tetrahydromethanopterin reductase-like flavin-dependent oxidoreductase (luciferase family)
MHVGYTAIFQNPGERLSDTEVYQNELRLAELAEPLGFESIWSVEHHFTDYTMCPDVVQFLTYMAGRTRKAQLGSMVVVLPWHDPMRVAEQISMLDHVSGGRMILGIGRGVGRVEYEGFRLDMNTSRERFEEYTAMLLDGLEQGYLEGAGEYAQQPKRDIRPRPLKSFRGRTYGAAVSNETMPLMVKNQAGLLVVPQKPWSVVKNDILLYNEAFRKDNGCDAPPPLVAGWTFVDDNADRAEELGRKYIADYYESVIQHYEFDDIHLSNTKGYEFYGKGFQEKIRELGRDKVIDFLVDLAVFGTPEQCYERIMHFHNLTGNNGYMAILSYSGMPYDEAERNMRLFASSVLPELKKVEVQSPEFALSA